MIKATIWIAGIVLAAIGIFFSFNSYIYNQKQGELPPVLIDGEHLGFIHAFTDNNTAIDFDDALWLSGTAGQDAAIRAGVCTEETRSDCLPNDFFIENTDPKDRRVAVDPQIKVTMHTWQMENTGQVTAQEIPLTDFTNLINDPTLHWQTLPYTITIQNNAVIKIKEVYVP